MVPVLTQRPRLLWSVDRTPPADPEVPHRPGWAWLVSGPGELFRAWPGSGAGLKWSHAVDGLGDNLHRCPAQW